MISRSRNSFFLALVAMAALALSVAQPMAFACQLQMNVHQNCAHGAASPQNQTGPQCAHARDAQAQDTPPHGAHSLGAAHSHAAVHVIEENSALSTASTQHCHSASKSHQPLQRDDTHSCKCSPGDAPATPPVAVQLSVSQSELSIPVTASSLRLPQPTTAPLWITSHKPPSRRDTSSLLSRAPPR